MRAVGISGVEGMSAGSGDVGRVLVIKPGRQMTQGARGIWGVFQRASGERGRGQIARMAEK